MKLKIYILVLTLFWVGCQSQAVESDSNFENDLEVAEVVEETAVPTNTPIPPTDTSEPTDTPPPTETATPTEIPATDTPIPTDTPEPTNTPEPSPTATNTPIPTATPIPPTPTPQPPPEVQSFPTTEVVAFTDELFLYHMDRLRYTMLELKAIYVGIEQGQSGNCTQFGSPFKNWTHHLPIYTDLPEKYYPLYVEYRAIIFEAVMSTREIGEVCAGGGGTVSDETDARILALLSWAVDRTAEMHQETIQLQQQ